MQMIPDEHHQTGRREKYGRSNGSKINNEA